MKGTLVDGNQIFNPQSNLIIDSNVASEVVVG